MANTKKKGVGREAKLTDDLIDEFCTYIENGMSNRDAADLCLIKDASLYRWLREADMVDEDGKPLKRYAMQRKLKQAIVKARASFKAYHVQSIIRASRKQWTASAWLLERKFPEEYGAVDRAGSIAIANRVAAEMVEDDGLVDALTAVPDKTAMIGDVPSDV